VLKLWHGRLEVVADNIHLKAVVAGMHVEAAVDSIQHERKIHKS
jgi:hypothetical protein